MEFSLPRAVDEIGLVDCQDLRHVHHAGIAKVGLALPERRTGRDLGRETVEEHRAKPRSAVKSCAVLARRRGTGGRSEIEA